MITIPVLYEDRRNGSSYGEGSHFFVLIAISEWQFSGVPFRLKRKSPAGGRGKDAKRIL